jgi:hypothetical protein
MAVAAQAYLTDAEWEMLSKDWLDHALAYRRDGRVARCGTRRR